MQAQGTIISRLQNEIVRARIVIMVGYHAECKANAHKYEVILKAGIS